MANYPDEYDPDLHGEWLEDNKGNPYGHPNWRPWNAQLEKVPPPAARGTALTVTLAIVLLPILTWWLL